MSAAENTIDLMEALRDSLARTEEKSAPAQEAPAAMPTPGVGIHAGLTWNEYHGATAASNSRLALLRQSPAHLLEDMRNPPDPTAEQLFGQAFHALVLEPDTFRDRFTLAGQCEATTKAGSRCSNMGSVQRDGQWFCGLRGHDPHAGQPGDERIVLGDEEWTHLHNMREAVMRHPEAGPAIEGAQDRELSAFWLDPETEQLCKARWDAPNAEAGVIIDLKSCVDASPAAFRKSLGRWGYHRQNAFYLDGAQVSAPDAFQQFFFLAVEKTRPYGAVLYELPDIAVDRGREEYRELLAIYDRCIRTGDFPCYPTGVHYLDVPQWVYWAEGPLNGDTI